MTPLQIEILFWYHVRRVDYREGDFSAPAVRAAIDQFRDETGLLEVMEPDLSPGDSRTYRTTDKARAYLEALQAMPLPVCRWEIPAP